MKSQKWFLVMAILVIASMVLAACAPATPVPTEPPATTEEPSATEPPAATESPEATEEPASTPADTIIIGTTDTIASFDPADAYAVRDWEIIKNINRGLLKWQPGTADVLQPDMATALPEISEDGLTYTLTLKDGIMFGDGTEMTAQIYVDSINRLLTVGPDCPNGVAGALATPYVESVEATDDSTIVFTLKSPVAFFPQILASATYTPAHPTIFAADECTLFPEAPIYGTGPWFVSQYTAGEQIVFEPNPYYNGELVPQVSQVIVRDYADPQTMALALQNGEIDIAWRYLGTEMFGQLQGGDGWTSSTIDGGSIRYLIINHTMAPMDDPNVLKAIASAVDRDALSDTVFGGQVSPLYSQVPPGFLGASEAFDTMYASPDLDAAREFLAASGYDETNKVQIELWYPPEHYGAETAAWMQVLEQQLEATGAIDVTLQSQEWSTYVTALTGGDSYPAGVLGWFFDYPDPSNYLDPFVFNGGQGTNVAIDAEGSAFGEPINEQAQQLVDLMAQADVEPDLEARAELYRQIQDLYAELVVTLPLFYNPEYVVFRDNISGSDQFPTPETLNIGPTIEFNYATLSKTP